MDSDEIVPCQSTKHDFDVYQLLTGHDFR